MQLLDSLSKFQKICIGILCVCLAIVLSLDVAIYRAFQVNPFTYRVTYKTLKSSHIPPAMNQVSAVYISDLEYSSLCSEQTMQAVFERIEAFHPDLFFFGGDLFSWDESPDGAMQDLVASWLGQIEAPLGKFAVLGEQDTWNDARRTTVQNIYDQAQVEILDNTSLTIGNKSRNGIRLTGLSPTADFEKAFSHVSSDQYNLLLVHFPDTLLEDAVALTPVSYALAGDSHGTQITWPLLGGYRQWEGAESLTRSKAKHLSFPYYITSGLGLIDVKARLNAPVEIVYLLFLSS